MPVLYSFSHCLTMMATEADERLQTRLENQRAFSHTTHRSAGNGGDDIALLFDQGEAVELTKGGLIEKLESCPDMCWRASSTGSGPAGVRSAYDCTLKAVRTAEKRPAYEVRVCLRSEVCSCP